MKWFTEFAAWIAGGVILGAIIHIVVIFAIPVFADGDAWAKLRDLTDEHVLAELEIDENGNALLPGLDPNMRYAVCRFDLGRNPLRVDAVVPPGYWAISLYDRRGVNYYTINDRAIPLGVVTLWIANKRQLLAIQPERPEVQEDRLIVGARDDLGFVVFQAIVDKPSQEEIIKDALAETDCRSEEYPAPAPPQG